MKAWRAILEGIGLALAIAACVVFILACRRLEGKPLVASQTAEQVWALADLVQSPAAAKLPAEWTAAARQVLADHRIELIERPSRNPGDQVYGNARAGNPGASPKQLEVKRAFFEVEHDPITGRPVRRYRLIACAGANRSGKTQAIGPMCFCAHLRDHARDGELYWVVAQDTTKLREGPQKVLWDFLPRSMFPKNRRWTEQLGLGNNPRLPLKLPGGRGTARVVFKTEEQDLNSFESDSVTGIWWTEATWEALLASLLPRIADTRGWVLMDYVPKMAWHKHKVRLSPNPRWATFRFAMKDNAHNLPPGEIAEQRASMSERDARIKIDGEEGAAFGAVYREFLRDRHVIDPFPIPAAAHQALYRCYDYGYSSPSACLWAMLLPIGFVVPREAGELWGGRTLERETLVVYRELYERELTIPAQGRKIKLMSGLETYRFGNRMVCDPSIYNRTQVGADGRAKSIAQLFEAVGVPCRAGVRSAGQEDALVAKVRLWFESDRLLFFRTCENAIREHESWRFKETADGEPRPDEQYENKDNHTCDAIKQLIAENLTYHQPKAAVLTASDMGVRTHRPRPRPRRSFAL